MKSVASTLLEQFDIQPSFRPAVLEDVVVGLVTTLATHGLLSEAVETIEDHTGLEFDGNTTALNGVAGHAYIPYMYKTPGATTLMLNLMVYIPVDEAHALVTLDSSILVGASIGTRKRNLLRNIDVINAIDIGVKLYLPYASVDQIGIIVYEDHKGLLKTLSSLNLPIPVLDRILQ